MVTNRYKVGAGPEGFGRGRSLLSLLNHYGCGG